MKGNSFAVQPLSEEARCKGKQPGSNKTSLPCETGEQSTKCYYVSQMPSFENVTHDIWTRQKTQSSLWT